MSNWYFIVYLHYEIRLNLAGRLWLEHLSSDQQSNRISLSQCSVTQSNSRRLQPHPPTGGHGLNTAVHDAYNLSWKIAATLRSLWSDEPQAKEVRLRFEEALAQVLGAQQVVSH